MNHVATNSGGSLLDILGSTTAVVCHDAGAANIIQAWVAAWPNHAWRPFMAGPAAETWKSRQLPIAILPSLESALDGAEVLLSGTGWATELEHSARKIASAKRVRNIAVLDHWVNYTSRFVRGIETMLPDEIVVTDVYAQCEAERCFPELAVSVYENFYVTEQINELSRLGGAMSEILYLLEPIRADWPRHSTGEFEALDFFVAHRQRLGIPIDTPLRLRPHPSDPPGKYAGWISEHGCLNVVLDDSPSLAIALAQARWVVGCETAAMVIALAAGRTVISSLPPWAPPCRLPHDGIIHLREWHTHHKVEVTY